MTRVESLRLTAEYNTQQDPSGVSSDEKRIGRRNQEQGGSGLSPLFTGFTAFSVLPGKLGELSEGSGNDEMRSALHRVKKIYVATPTPEAGQAIVTKWTSKRLWQSGNNKHTTRTSFSGFSPQYTESCGEDDKVYGFATTTMHDMSIPPPP